MGYDAAAYTSYNFVKGPGCPAGLTVADQMAAAAADAVELLVVVNQNGGQNSNSTIGVVYEDIHHYLASPSGSKWNVTILGQLLAIVLGCAGPDAAAAGIDDYSQTDAFNQLIVQHTLVSSAHSC
jgi:hypothetical protein